VKRNRGKFVSQAASGEREKYFWASACSTAGWQDRKLETEEKNETKAKERGQQEGITRKKRRESRTKKKQEEN
jgi:hypothetical protein